MSTALAYGVAVRQLRVVRHIVLEVDFRARGGQKTSAIGGGSTVAEALESAREALPPGAWTAVAWKELYGD